MFDHRPLRIALDRALKPWLPEAKYVFRTLCRVAGYPYTFVWADEPPGEPDWDIHYGFNSARGSAAISIPAGGAFSDARCSEPVRIADFDGLPLLTFDDPVQPGTATPERLVFPHDLVFSTYWLLTGAREPEYPRDRFDNLDMANSFFVRHRLAEIPFVSLWGQRLREFFAAQGRLPADPPWLSGGKRAAVSLTLDVDYPEIIRSIECLRLLATLGVRGARSIGGVLKGSNHFWKFQEWIEFASRFGARPAFYFIARKGSLLGYALGTPDGFYDIRSKQFRRLFQTLRASGCEIGLHASYNAYKSAAQIAAEKELLEAVSRSCVIGGRHHYWHLDPERPHETLLKHVSAGMTYDSSLGLEFYPGFRRGICHPFRPYHPGERREIDLVELPPTWMDDHFDRRRRQNHIVDPDAHAANLWRAVRSTGGMVVLAYHVRGMNNDFFPRYGEWLRAFLEGHVDSSTAFATPADIATQYVRYESALEAASRDETEDEMIRVHAPAKDLRIGPMEADEVDAVAAMHYEFFGVGEVHGYSLAKLGPDALAGLFYHPSLDNPHLFVDVAKYRGKLVGFSSYSTSRAHVFPSALRRHFVGMVASGLTALLRHPAAFMSLLSSVRYVGGEKLPEALSGGEIKGWFFLLGVLPPFRTREFERSTGVHIAAQLRQRMESTLLDRGCDMWYGAVRQDNAAMNVFMQRSGARVVGTGRAQGQLLNYYLKRLHERPVAVEPDALTPVS